MINIHPLSDVQSPNIGENTSVWQYTVILAGAVIGSNCNINCHTFIENDVKLGNNVTIKSGVYLWDGINIENDVFVGPNATFTNDKYPRSKQHRTLFQKTTLGRGCSIGANAVILGGITIGEYAIVGAGTLVTKNVPPFALFYGHPGEIKGWVDTKGTKLKRVDKNHFEDIEGNTWLMKKNYLTRK